MKHDKQWYAAAVKMTVSNLCICMCVCLPEGEDNKAGDNEDCSKYNENVVTGISPPSIVEHLCRLLVEKIKINYQKGKVSGGKKAFKLHS